MFQGLRRWYVWLKHQGWSVHIFGIFSRHCHGFMNVCTWSQSLTFWSIWMLTSSQILGPRSRTDEDHTWYLINVSCTIFKVSLEDSDYKLYSDSWIHTQIWDQDCPANMWSIFHMSPRHSFGLNNLQSFLQTVSYNYLLWLLDFWTGQLTEVSKFLHIQ